MREVKILRIDRDRPDVHLISEAAAAIRDGGVIAYLTDTLYGLGADAFNPEAVRRVFEIKSRTHEKALPVIIGSVSMLSQIATEISPEAQKLISNFWPGPLSLILPAAPALPAVVHGNTGKIAVRIPACASARELAIATSGVLTATSANVSGQAPAQSAKDILALLGEKIDMVIDSGPAMDTRPSTLLDVTVWPPRLLREGAISIDRINAATRVER
jgi:L-threonylcarbamoyladenylate synthase